MPNTFKNYMQANVSANQVVHTVASGTQTTVIGFTMSNVTQTAQTGNVSVVSTGDTNSYSVVHNASIPAGGTLVPIGGNQKLVLEAGDSITVKCSGNTDIIMSVLEIT